MDKLCPCLAQGHSQGQQTNHRRDSDSPFTTSFNLLLDMCVPCFLLCSYKILQRADCVEPVVPSSRGAHGLFRSSLPSQKPADFALHIWQLFFLLQASLKVIGSNTGRQGSRVKIKGICP